jgi:ferric-dicitrate binding protein FerR (iron transport regulator)
MDRELLDRYARGECTGAECRRVEQWLQGEEELPTTSAQAIQRGQEIWRLLEARTSETPPSRKRLRIVYIAAGLAAAVLPAFFVPTHLFRKPAPVAREAWAFVNNPPGKLLKLTLPDSSTIHLAGGARITYPKRFANDRREIRFIDGEAYFSVHPDPARPFLVNIAEDSKILVLGTEFNIKQPDAGQPLQITLMSGKVAYQKGTEQEILLPGEQLTSIHGNIRKRHIANPQSAGAWKDGILWFERTPIKEVFEQLQRHYGVRFSGIATVEEQELNGRFDRQPLDQVLGIISQSTDISFERQGSEVCIVKKSNIQSTKN